MDEYTYQSVMIEVQGAGKHDGAMRVISGWTSSMNSPYSLCLGQDYHLTETIVPNNEKRPLLCKRSILFLMLNSKEDFKERMLTNACTNDHEIAGYMVAAPDHKRSELFSVATELDIDIVMIQSEKCIDSVVKLIQLANRYTSLSLAISSHEEKIHLHTGIPSYHPVERIRQLLKDATTPISKKRFLEIMWNMNRLEDMPPTQNSREMGGDILKCMAENFDSSLSDSCLLYLVMIFRCFRKEFNHLYPEQQRTELALRITSSIDHLSTQWHALGPTLVKCIQSDNCNPYFRWEDTNWSTFQLIQTACESALTYRSQRLESSECSAYQVIFWGVLSQKFYLLHPSRRAGSPATGVGFWRKHFIEKMKSRAIDPKVIQNIQMGREFGMMLGLEQQYLLDFDCLTELLCRRHCCITFPAIREIMSSLTEKQAKEFLRVSCDIHKSMALDSSRYKQYLRMTVYGNASEVIDQVLMLIDFVQSEPEPPCIKMDLEVECEHWFNFLVEFASKHTDLAKLQLLEKISASSFGKQHCERLCPKEWMENDLAVDVMIEICGIKDDSVIQGSIAIGYYSPVDSPYSLCLEQEYQLTEEFSHDQTLTPLSFLRKIVFVMLNDEESLQERVMTNEQKHEIAGYLVSAPTGRKDDLLLFAAQSQINVVVFEPTHSVEYVRKLLFCAQGCSNLTLKLRLSDNDCHTGRKQVKLVSPAERINRLLTESKEFTSRHFLEVMWHMNLLEQKVHNGSTDGVDSVLSCLKRNVDRSLPDGFLLFLTLVYRFFSLSSHKDNTLSYKNINDVWRIITHAIPKTSLKAIAASYLSFVSQASHDTTFWRFRYWSTLQLTFDTLVFTLEKENKNLKNRDCQYYTCQVLFWGMLLLRANELLPQEDPARLKITGSKFWEMYFLQATSQVLSESSIDYFERIHSFGRELQISKANLIGADCFIQLLSRSSYDFEVILSLLTKLDHLETEHIKPILAVACGFHKTEFKNDQKRYLKSVCRGEPKDLINQGLSLLRVIESTNTDGQYTTECVELLEFFIWFACNQTSERHVLLRDIVVFGQDYSPYQACVQSKVLEGITDRLQSIELSDFLKLCVAPNFPLSDHIEVIEKYFRNCPENRLLPDLKISHWKEFLKIIISKHPGKQHLKLFTALLEKFKIQHWKRYSKLNCFLDDLIEFHVPGLLCGVCLQESDDMTTLIQVVCSRVNIKTLMTFTVNLSKSVMCGVLQEVVLSAIQLSLDKWDVLKEDISTPLKRAIDNICRDLPSSLIGSTLQHHGCWVFIQSVTGKLKVRKRDFIWIKANLATITKLGKLSTEINKHKSSLDFKSLVEEFSLFDHKIREVIDDLSRFLKEDSFTYSEMKSLIVHYNTAKELFSAYVGCSTLPKLEHLHKKKLQFKKNFRGLRDLVILDRGNEQLYELETLLKKYNIKLPRKFESRVHLPPVELPDSVHLKDFSFYKTSNLTFFNLNLLLEEVNSLLIPMLKYRHLWIVHAESELFQSYFKCMHESCIQCAQTDFSDSVASEIVILGNALDATSSLLTRILQHTKLTFQDITVQGKIQLEDIKADLSQQLYSIASALSIDEKSIPTDRVEGVMAIIELVQMRQFVKNVCGVCKMFQLGKCTECRNFGNLSEIASVLNDSSKRDKMDPDIALEQVRFVKSQLQPCTHKYSDLFEQLQLSWEFYSLVRKNFYESESPAVASDNERLRSFRQTLEVITQQLQHEEYEEQVLNHLYPAFVYILPFMDREQTFQKLMSKVSQLDTSSNFSELKNVRQNMNQIKQWFQQTEGEFAFSNVYSELENILESGEYSFTLTSRLDVNMCLRFNKEVHNGVQDTGSWDSLQITAFEQKLSLVDDKEGIQEKITTLLTWNEIGRKLLTAILDLNKLGHADLSIYTAPLKIGDNLQEAESKVMKAEKELEECTKHIRSIYQTHKPLLFFSIIRLFRLFECIETIPAQQDSQPCMKKIAAEVSFLFYNSLEVWQALKTFDIKVLLPSEVMGAHPIKVVGTFLDALCSSPCISDFVFPRRTVKTIDRQQHKIGVEIYVAHNFTQEKLIRIVLTLFGGIPEAFDILHCKSSTTVDDLELFINRTQIRKLQRTFFILEVNALPYHLQEHLLVEQLLNYQTDSRLILIETKPSLFREVSGVDIIDCKEIGSSLLLTTEEASDMCMKVLSTHQYGCNFEVVLVYGRPGVGKTHFIQKELHKMSNWVIITLNETFLLATVINKLNQLDKELDNCGIFFNYTLSPPGDAVSEAEQHGYYTLQDKIGWFFFNLVVLGHVEDDISGVSFHSPIGQRWRIFVEVPSCRDAENSVDEFCKDVAPALGLVGSRVLVESDSPFDIDDNVLLVCKYIKAFKDGRINALYIDWGDAVSEDSDDEDVKEVEVTFSPSATVNQVVEQLNDYGLDFEVIPKIQQLVESRKLKKLMLRDKPISFRTDQDPTAEECWDILYGIMPAHVKENKVSQKLFIRYMARRFRFMEDFPSFVFNSGFAYRSHETVSGRAGAQYTNTVMLGQVVIQAMLDEVSEVCVQTQIDWSCQTHQQLIYDVKDGGGTVSLIALKPEKIDQDVKKDFKDIGVEVLPESELHERKVLESYLCSALYEDSRAETVQGCQKILSDANYILTLDFLLKMLKIHERRVCGVPVIIEGETGVGKTALVEMLSMLWNHGWMQAWRKQRESLIERVTSVLGEPGSCLACALNTNDQQTVTSDWMMNILDIADKSTEDSICFTLRDIIIQFKFDLVLPLLQFHSFEKASGISNKAYSCERLVHLHNVIKTDDWDKKDIADLLNLLFKAETEVLFHKLNVHAALNPDDIFQFLEKMFAQASSLKEAYPNGIVTLYLDEVNTSTCSGYFKEIIIDGSIDGKAIPTNVFVIAACNPHRGNSLVSRNDDVEMKNSYYVRELHPTMQLIKWDFGALDDHQERLYVQAKLEMIQSSFLDKAIGGLDLSPLTELIVDNQIFMRKCAERKLAKLGYDQMEATMRAKSCVSQRDIQRLFMFYEYFVKLYSLKDRLAGSELNPSSYHKHRRALLVSFGLVYYMRLTAEDREKYIGWIESRDALFMKYLKFGTVLKEETDWLIRNIELPPGIAKTEALKENLIAIVSCCVAGVPLIIEGAPGTSKTLSFNIAVGNLKGVESIRPVFKNSQLFPSLDPYFYQCSRRTTSEEVETVFKRAVNRQLGHNKRKGTGLSQFRCVVFMDEAGLPERTHESLKVLHYYLEHPIVSFVAITNHPLDAAKTNRAVSVYRPEIFKNDIQILATDCLGLSEEKPPHAVVQLCHAYTNLMKNFDFSRFFGLRDFVYFLIFLRRNCTKGRYQSEMVVKGLQRNFGGVNTVRFSKLIAEFLGKDSYPESALLSCIDLLKESFAESCLSEDSEFQTSIQSDVRYKLFIDPSEDDSLTRIMFRFGLIGEEKKLRQYVCSDLAGSNYSEVNTIARVRHSAIEGHTIVMYQTDNIHECFYDLFNQRFRCITVQGQYRYYANIAKGTFSKLSRVSPEFQCVIVIKSSEILTTPNAFLNRFEKYALSHEELLDIALDYLPPCFRILFKVAFNKARQFVKTVEGSKSLYGYLDQTTLVSVMLTVLPTTKIKHSKVILTSTHLDRVICEGDSKISTLIYILRLLVISLEQCGFYFFQDPEELMLDAEAILVIVEEDDHFRRLLSSREKDQLHLPIKEAFQTLCAAPGPSDTTDSKVEMFPDACLIISILQQWLVRYLCKKLMQIMTPEGLAVHYRKIPKSYREVYLKHQEHFNLKQMIARYLTFIKDPRIENCATKLLCFTRLSQMVTQAFPVLYRGDQKSDNPYYEQVQRMFHEDPGKVIICKISSNMSQSHVEKLLKDFVSSDKLEVLVFTAAFQGVRKKMQKIINHVRIMIEEEEILTRSKLFVVLVHFPPVMFFSACYPSLFLHGWDHFYLDSVSQTGLRIGEIETPSVNIKDWFLRFCLKQCPSDDPNHVVDTLEKMLLRESSYAIIVSRARFGTNKKALFNHPMDAYERSQQVQCLFRDFEIGKTLINMFMVYWSRKNMNRYVQNAAIHSYTRESRLSLTDSIQHMLQTLFLEFLSYMVSWMNADYSVDLLFSCGVDSEHMKECFIAILRSIPVPHLQNLEGQAELTSSTFRKPSEWKLLSFPFSAYILSLFELVTNRCRQEIHLLTNVNSVDIQKEQHLENEVIKLAVKEFKKVLEIREATCVEKICSVISTDEKGNGLTFSLWSRYLKDFICQRIIEEDQDSDVETCIHILEEYFSPLKTKDNVLCRMFTLHVHTAFNHLNLKRLLAVLLAVNDFSMNVTSKKPLSDADKSIVLPMQASKPISCHYGELVSSIIFNLFQMMKALQTVPYSSLKSWIDCYLNMISIPTIKHNLYQCAEVLSVALKFSAMQTTYLAFQSISALTEEDQIELIRSLISALLDCEVDGVPVYEKHSIKHFMMISVATFGEIVKSEQLQTFIERMFEHMLSINKSLVNDLDFEWFLLLANMSSKLMPIELLISKSLSWSSYRYYLQWLLGSAPEGIDMEESISEGNGLPLFSPEVRKLVEISLSSSATSGVLQYVPQFYQNEQFCSFRSMPNNEGEPLNQRLAHLYFEVVLQRLQSQKLNATLSSCIRAAAKINDALKKTASRSILLIIEKQALIQHIIQLLATGAQRQVQHMNSLRLVKTFNELLEESMVEAHAVSIALNLLKSDDVRSTSKLLTILEDEEGYKKELTCLKHLDNFLPDDVSSKAALFPFIRNEDDTCELSDLYRKVSSSMNAIHDGIDSVAVEFDLLSSKWCSSNAHTCDGICGHLAFEMCVWLSTYYNFYSVKKTSIVLARIMKGRLFKLDVDEGRIQIIAAFLDPDNFMIHANEAVLPSDFDPDGMAPAMNGGGTDPLFELFTLKGMDSSDRMLHHSIANLIAVVFGLPPKSNHLWFHLFCPQDLSDTFMLGYLYISEMSPPYFYDCGVELHSNGIPARSEYDDRIEQTPLDLQSLHLVWWGNFAMFCVSLLTQQDTQISGTIITYSLPVRQYCLSKMMSSWVHMQTTMGLTVEELSFFLMKCCQQLLEVGTKSPHLIRGLIHDEEDWDEYEEVWHTMIFSEAKTGLHQCYQQCCRSELNSEILQLIKSLESVYPFFPNEMEVAHCFNSQNDLSTSCPVLYQFVRDYKKLEVGSSILPDLVEFYQWLHTDLNQTLTNDEAFEMTVIDKVNEFAERYADTNHLPEIYRQVQAGYNKFVSAMGNAIGSGACALMQRQNKVFDLSDETKIFPLLSSRDGGDWLFVVIENIVKFHNRMMTTLYEYGSNQGLALSRPREVNLLEVNKAMCLVEESDSFLQMVRRRSYIEDLDGHTVHAFNFSALQKDVINVFLSGKPQIKEPVRLEYQYKKWTIRDSPIDVNAQVSCLSTLPNELKISLESKLVRELELHFHSANFDQIMGVFSGMKIIAMHLRKEIEDSSNLQLEGLKTKTFLKKYMFASREQAQLDNHHLFKDIGMTKLTNAQTESLGEIHVNHLYGTVKLFTLWITVGYYNYCMLPLGVKKHLDDDVEDKLCKLPDADDYSGSLLAGSALDTDLAELFEAFPTFEGYLEERHSDYLQDPIMTLLSRDFGVISEDNKLLRNIPHTVLVENYVPFRIALSQMQKSRESEISKEKHFSVREVDRWKEPDVFELWEKHFTHVSRQIKRANVPRKEDSDDLDTDDEVDSHVDSRQRTDSDDWKLKAEKLTTEQIMNFLLLIKLDDCIKEVGRAGVDGSLMVAAVTSASDDILKDIGFKRAHQTFKVRKHFKEYALSCDSQ